MFKEEAKMTKETDRSKIEEFNKVLESLIPSKPTVEAHKSSAPLEVTVCPNVEITIVWAKVAILFGIVITSLYPMNIKLKSITPSQSPP